VISNPKLLRKSGLGVTVWYYLTRLDEGWVPVGVGTYDPKRSLVLARAAEVDDWPPLEVAVEADELIDYLPNNVGPPLCSERMRGVIEQALGPLDHVQWLPAVVVDIFGTKHSYFVLHLPDDVDILDEAKSIIVDEDVVVKPVISLAKVKSRNLVRVRKSSTLFLTEQLRQVLYAAHCSGVDFERAAVA
jgi:hypothetical protein